VGASGVLTGGSSEDLVYLDLAHDLLLGPQPGPVGVTITDETPTARAKRRSHS
jgi:hypothetical protein